MENLENKVKADKKTGIEKEKSGSIPVFVASEGAAKGHCGEGSGNRTAEGGDRPVPANLLTDRRAGIKLVACSAACLEEKGRLAYDWDGW